jgi:hypothetical protein
MNILVTAQIGPIEADRFSAERTPSGDSFGSAP